jgi:uncharacterized NAD(P)/FAD-binding protein YdhS/quercetin dioxygenase-like cupin family protein
MTPALSSLIEKLAQLTAHERVDAESLARALETSIEFDDVRSFIRFDGESYERALVFRNERVELRLLCWRPGQSTSLHGHGDAACAFRIIRGAATETVLGGRDRVWSPGSVVIEGGARVHQVQNASSDSLLTLHAYSPPLPVDAPSSPLGHQVVIAGGGFSAAALAYHLLRRGSSSLRVHVVETGPWFGRGIAYGVESEVFRLNVPASKMSIDPDVPDDFVKFAGAEAEPNAFLSRALYGRYITARLASALRESRAKLRLWRDEAVAATDGEVTLRSGRRLSADAVVLATGLTPRLRRAPWHAGVVDAWDECALATISRKARVLLVGSGLTALDVIAFLDAQRFEGSVTVVSRRALLPLPHEEKVTGVTPLSGEEVGQAPRNLRALVKWVRESIRAGHAGGAVPWQRSVDRLRPHVASLYRGLSHADRARFVRHIRPYWDVVRHRAPADALARVEAMQAAGRLRRIAGRVSIGEGGPDVAVEIFERFGARRSERFDAVVRCIGPALDVAEGETPLLRSLLDGGLARVTPHGLGIETLADGRLVDARGEPSARLFGIGAVRRASHWETTSVPDIAIDAQRVAALLVR